MSDMGGIEEVDFRLVGPKGGLGKESQRRLVREWVHNDKMASKARQIARKIHFGETWGAEE